MAKNLRNYDLSKEPDLKTAIDKAKKSRTSYQNLSLKIKFKDTLIEFPNNIFHNYMELIKSKCFEVPLDDDFIYQPEKLSYELYGTTDLSFLLLSINNITSPVDFNKSKIMVFDPTEISLIVDIINKFQPKLKENALNPMTIGDSTIKRVIV